MRASGSDDAIKIAPKLNFSLEESMEHIKDDEYLEVTPLSLRMRKMPGYKFALIFSDNKARTMNKKLFLLFLVASLMRSTLSGQENDLSKYGIETKNSHIPSGLNAGDFSS